MKVFAFADEAGIPLSVQIEAMRRNGLQGIELRKLESGNVIDLSDEEAREIRARLEAEGLRVWSIGSPLGKTRLGEDDFSHELDRLRRTLELCDLLGTDRIRMFSFYPRQGTTQDDCRSEVLDRLHAMAELTRNTGVLLCHENEKGIYGDLAPRCLDIVREIPEIRNVFDPANYIQAGQDTAEAWAMLRPYTDYLHIKDALPTRQVVPCGKGIGNVADILRDFIADGGRNVTIEPHLKVFSGLAQLEQAGNVSNIDDNVYPDSDTAFDAACSAFRAVLTQVTTGQED